MFYKINKNYLFLGTFSKKVLHKKIKYNIFLFLVSSLTPFEHDQSLPSSASVALTPI